MSDDHPRPLFDAARLRDVPTHDHGCNLPHVNGVCSATDADGIADVYVGPDPKNETAPLMVQQLQSTTDGDDLFARYNAAARDEIASTLRLPPSMVRTQYDEPRHVYGVVLVPENVRLPDEMTRQHSAHDVAHAAYIALRHLTPMTPPDAMLDATPVNECTITVLEPDAWDAFAAHMPASSAIQCDAHEMFLDDDGMSRCVFCCATQDDIDAHESMMQAMAHESLYGSCHHCKAVDSDPHDGDCPRGPLAYARDE